MAEKECKLSQKQSKAFPKGKGWKICKSLKSAVAQVV